MSRTRLRIRRCLLLGMAVVLLAGGESVMPAPASAGIPWPDHIVIVIEENKTYTQIVGNPDAPYINSLALQGALFSRSSGVGYPSQPNYLALFSGTMQEVGDNSCPHTFRGDNLGSELIRAGLSFGSFSESMPSVGFQGCEDRHYVRKHNPCVNWQGVNIPATANMPYTSFPKDYSMLPTVSIVIPDMDHDMHDGSIRAGDDWLKRELDSFVRWARTNNSLLILTWDEDDHKNHNHIPTIFVGPMVKAGVYTMPINHYHVLRTIEEMYGLRHLGNSEHAPAITNVWVTRERE